MNLFSAGGNLLEIHTVRRGGAVVPEPGMTAPVDEETFHVWTARYSDLARHFVLLFSLVSGEEQTKAAAYKKTCDAKRYILRHGMLRAVLAQYLGQDPAEISFVTGMNGKPELDSSPLLSDIRFSLSDTDDRVCLGIARGTDIGVDTVKKQSCSAFYDIQHSFFSRGESRWIDMAEPGLHHERFIRIWALKEALIKATGSDARLMQEGDLTGILTVPHLNGVFSLQIGGRAMDFFIHESGTDDDHHQVIAALMSTGYVHRQE